MKIEFQNSVRRLSFLCHLPGIKIAWINSSCVITEIQLVLNLKIASNQRAVIDLEI